MNLSQPPPWSHAWKASGDRDVPTQPIGLSEHLKPKQHKGFRALGIIAFVICVVLGIALGSFMIWGAYEMADGHGPGSGSRSALRYVLPVPKN